MMTLLELPGFSLWYSVYLSTGSRDDCDKELDLIDNYESE